MKEKIIDHLPRIIGLVLILLAVGAAVFVYLHDRFLPKDGDPLAGEPVLVGKETAPVTVVEFYSYLCPYCRRHALEVFPKIEEEWVRPGLVRYYFHPVILAGEGIEAAMRASEAARCAARAGRFLTYHHALFEEVDRWRTLQGKTLISYLEGLAERLEVQPLEAFHTCLEDGLEREAVRKSTELAAALGIAGVPTFYINGRPRTGVLPYEAWKSLLEDALKAAQGRGGER